MNLLVLVLDVQVDVLSDLNVPERESIIREAATAHRDRARLLRSMNRKENAQADERRASQLDVEAKEKKDSISSTQVDNLAKELRDLRREVKELNAMIKDLRKASAR